MRAAGVEGFGVNLFVPGEPAADPGAVAAYVTSLAAGGRCPRGEPGSARLGRRRLRGQARRWSWPRRRPPSASPSGSLHGDVVRALQAAGSLVLVTVTTPEEAARALRAGPDALCLQGAEAGAHRGSLANDDRPDQDRPVRALLASVRRRTLVPLVAAGGVSDPADVTDLLARGATLVQAGTAFLRCPESGAHPRHKEALGDSEGVAITTAVTRAFSGRRARALANAMVRDHPDAPAAYPEINNATRPLRAAAARSGDAGHMSLYAGTGFRAAPARPGGRSGGVAGVGSARRERAP